jgi:flagellar biosynthesis/type III secretory pathway protein FliH
VTTARARFDCPAILLVVALNEAVARWARASIDLGHPGFTLKPIAISAAQIPQIVDEKQARRSPHLAVLSALAHPRLHVASAAIAGLDRLPEEQSRLYFDAVLAGLPPIERQILEAQMQGYQYRSQFARTFIAQGREEGREMGREEGRQQGKQLAALELAEAKLGRLAVEEESAILSMQEETQLSALIVGLGQARNRREAKAAMPLAMAVRA